MAVWWLAIIAAVMLAYYGLYVSDSADRRARRIAVLVPSALLLLATAFLLSNASTLMQRPDQWLRWFTEPHGVMLNLDDAALLPRFLHIIVASLAVGGLSMAWRARWSLRRPEPDADRAGRRCRRGLAWFSCASLVQIAAGPLFLFSLPADVRALFLGGSLLHTGALILAVAGLIAALLMARRERLGLTSAFALGVILVMVCIRALVREAMLSPYSPALASVPPTQLAMPRGQTEALLLFLICAVLSIPVLVWLIRAVLRAGQGTVSGAADARTNTTTTGEPVETAGREN